MRFLTLYVALNSVVVSTIMSGFAWKLKRNNRYDRK